VAGTDDPDNSNHDEASPIKILPVHVLILPSGTRKERKTRNSFHNSLQLFSQSRDDTWDRCFKLSEKQEKYGESACRRVGGFALNLCIFTTRLRQFF
jgi:hypothetical protein